MKTYTLAVFSLCAVATVVGCDAARDVEVTGEVSSSQTIAGPIALSFYEVEKDAEDAERVLIKTAELAALGAFSETIEVAEDVVIVVALADDNGDGLCTDGELWGEAQQEVSEDDTVDAFALELRADPCPAEE